MSERKEMNLTPEERALQDAIRDLGEVRPDADFQARLRQSFISGDIDAAGPELVAAAPVAAKAKVIRWPWLAVPALAAAVLALFMLWGGGTTWSVHAIRGQGIIKVDGLPVASSDADRLNELVRPGSRLVVPAGVELELVYGNVFVLALIQDTEAVIPTAPNGGSEPVVATVDHGEFLIRTGPGFPGETLHLVTTEGLTEIVGTIVAINKGEGFTCVCVLEGTARIGRDRAHLTAISAGNRKVMFADGREPMLTPNEPAHEKDMKEFEARNESIFKD